MGGGVRDLLLGRKPKDFDVVTNALPDQVRQVFKRRCILIGRRFRLAHVRFGSEIIEVATFRGHGDETGGGDRLTVDDRIVRDNVYGAAISEDVWRRDFSVNGLYYNIADFSVIDFTGGMTDLESRTLRLIGDAHMRCREDAVRILRAVRFAAKLDFRFHPDTEAPIREFGDLLQEVPPARLFDETLKLFHGGHALSSFRLLRQYGLFGQLFPTTESLLAREESDFSLRLIERALANTDARIAEGKPVTPAFLFAALLWPPLQQQIRHRHEKGLPPVSTVEAVARKVIEEQIHRVTLPRRFSAMTKEIWTFQPRLIRTTKRQPGRATQHPRFRAAYDFLVLRAEAGEEEVREAARWWTEFQENHPTTREKPAGKSGGAKRRRAPGRKRGDKKGAPK
uniref:Poly(A) polymerase I n=1 Tax=Candidatus Kentrum sp. DK TaxID=2126562 RepID=A0A450SH38_9GAMM|nr:MAG: poly(A) polymerase [Candidatus Kentron sp. DK]